MHRADAPALLEQHRRLTSRVAGRLGRVEAEDLASEALARSFRRPAPDGRLGPWLETIFRNLIVDRSRRAVRWAAAVSQVTAPDDAPNPEELLLERERRRALALAIPTIPPPLRDALQARFYEDRDYEGVAASRGISAATARTRVHRGLERLRTSLARLRVIVPGPFLPGIFGGKGAAATAALLPMVMTVAVALPSVVGLGDRQVHSGGIAVPAVGRVGRVVRPWAKAPGFAAGRPLPATPVQPQPAATASPAVAPMRNDGAKKAAPAPAPLLSVQHRAAGGTAPAAEASSSATAVQRFNYDDDDIAGDLARPDGVLLQSDPRAMHSSLIEIPRDFVPAIAKMLEDM